MSIFKKKTVDESITEKYGRPVPTDWQARSLALWDELELEGAVETRNQEVQVWCDTLRNFPMRSADVHDRELSHYTGPVCWENLYWDLYYYKKSLAPWVKVRPL